MQKLATRGLTLSAETHGRFICTTKVCLSLWTPLVVAHGTTPAGAKLLATVRRPDGRTQVTYRGRPLYTFTEDTKPGDVKATASRTSAPGSPQPPTGRRRPRPHRRPAGATATRRS